MVPPCVTRPSAVCGDTGYENSGKGGGLNARGSNCLREPFARHAVHCTPGVCNTGRGVLVDGLNANNRIMCINPAESLEPVVVGQIPTDGPSFLMDLFVTDGGTIYVADWHQRKVFAFHPSSPTFTEVLQCPDGLHPVALLVQHRSLYVSMVAEESMTKAVDGSFL